MSMKENREFDLYKDIQGRTSGEIYIGVVGPVRTGKSTFIKRFMDLFVLPYIDDDNVKKRTQDELPQSSAGKTIMTTEPKFIPQEAACITLADRSDIKVRLIDCVGFMVDGANGHMEGDENRMVKTPWFDEEIPFVDAARIGTRKVIHDHATIGIVVTTDGSIGELPRESFLEPEQTTIAELKEIGKPYVIVLNSAKPYSDETRRLAESMSANYGTVVIPVNCQQMHSEDVIQIMNAILLEFPITRMDFFIPKWTEMLPGSHPVKNAIINAASGMLMQVEKVRDVDALTGEADLAASANEKAGEDFFKEILIPNVNLSDGTVTIRIQIDDKYYFDYISEMTGVKISGEYQMISMLRNLASMKADYEKVKDAMLAVEQKGYGVVMPGLSDIKMEDPVMIQHGGKFGVKMRAVSPSVHIERYKRKFEIYERY